ncbi:MAG: Crp/Fnr family transcriptional regulator [Candidatus Binatia bacterium]
MLDTLNRLLRLVPLFRGLGPSELAAVDQAAENHEVERARHFFEDGGHGDTVYLLRHGCVKIIQAVPRDTRVLLRVVGPGELFGAMGDLGDQLRPVSAQALCWCQALSWNRTVIGRFMKTYPVIALNALSELEDQLFDLQSRYQGLAAERVERRIARTLIRLAGHAGHETQDGLLIDLPLSRQDLATMTGTTLWTVSRILSAWERNGVIASGGQKVAILQPGGLLAMAREPTGHLKVPVALSLRGTPEYPTGKMHG